MGQQIQKQQKPIEQQEPNHHRRLPLEMESEIFKFLKWSIQLKLIATMGRGIYGLFHQRLIVKAKRLQNPTGNQLVLTESKIEILWDRRKFMINDWLGIDTEWKYIFAKKGFVISEGRSRKDNFPGTIVYYFEVTRSASASKWAFYVGLSNGIIPFDDKCFWEWPQFYLFSNCHLYNYERCCLSGYYHQFEWPNGRIKSKRNENGEFTIGCGILLNPENTLSIFFTTNGILMGKPIPIRLSFDSLIPTVCMLPYSVEANFGDNLAKKPFRFNISSLQLDLE